MPGGFSVTRSATVRAVFYRAAFAVQDEPGGLPGLAQVCAQVRAGAAGRLRRDDPGELLARRRKAAGGGGDPVQILAQTH
jgi:hypothetical protein